MLLQSCILYQQEIWKRASPLISIPEGYWYVSEFRGHSGSCEAQAKVSAKQLSRLKAFNSAVLGTRNKAAPEVLLKSVTENVHNVGNLSHSMVERACNIVKNTVNTNIRSLTSGFHPYVWTF